MSLRRVFEREAQGTARYRGLAAAWHVVRLDYGVAFLLFVSAIVGCLSYLALNKGGHFVYDDSYITLQFARNLLRYGRFTFDGVTTGYGATSPLHVALVAFVSVPLGRVEVAAFFLGITSLGLTGIFAYYWARAATQSRLTAALAGLLIVTSGWMIFDALSGMETVMFIMWLMLALFLFESGSLWYGIPLGLAALTRPDALLFLPGLALFALIRFISSRDPRTFYRLLGGAGLFVAVILPFLIVNYVGTGSLLPNTAQAKAYFFGEPEMALARKWQLLSGGMRLFYGRLIMTWPWLMVIGLALGRFWWRRYYALTATLVFYLGYFVQFPGSTYHYWGRYQHIFIPFVMLAMAEGSLRLGRIIPKGVFRWVAGLVLAVLLIANQAFSLAAERRVYAGSIKTTREVGEDIARYIREQAQPSDLVATHDIGALGYFSGRRVLDLVGLVNPDAAHLYRDPETGRQIDFGDRHVLEYVLACRPKFLVMFESWKTFLNLDPDRLPEHFTFVGQSKPLFPYKTGGYRIYAVKSEPD